MDTSQKILDSSNISDICQKLRNEGKTIAVCSGSYDLLQSGHAVFFQQCKEFADILIVSVGKDSVIQKLKGNSRPINPEQNRLFLIASMQNVDYAILGDDVDKMLPGKLDFCSTLQNAKPHFFILNDNDSAIAEKKELCNRLGIQLKLVPRIVPGFLKPTSSTEIIKKIQNLK